VKTVAALVAVLALLTAQTANAAVWYDRVSTQLQRVEVDATGAVILMVSGPTVWVTAADNSTCRIAAITVTPPAGKEKEYLAMALAATISGKAVSVYGTCNQSAYSIAANRMLVDY